MPEVGDMDPCRMRDNDTAEAQEDCYPRFGTCIKKKEWRC